jgi:enoyl-CoA hydratase/carnithine racemase
MGSPNEAKRVRLQRSPFYWRVTFGHPPLNFFGPETIPQRKEIVTERENDDRVRIVVFDSAVEGLFITHYGFLAKIEDLTNIPPGPTGLQALPDVLVHSRAPVVSIALIRGRATGVGSDLALASDMRFASRGEAILSHWEVGAGLGPGGRPMARLPRLIGRGARSKCCLRGRYSRRCRGAPRVRESGCLTRSMTLSSMRSRRGSPPSTRRPSLSNSDTGQVRTVIT